MPNSLPRFTPVAIIGMGCRFPSAENVGAYWRMLLAGVDAVTEIPADRWDVDEFYDPRPTTPCKVVSRSGGFISDVDRFDPYFFGISPREASRLDPQQRLLLEITWEAMENAGIRREQFHGSNTGVFVGVCTDDYITLERGDLRNIDIYVGTGGSRGSTAGRLAFSYGLSGPVAAIDTACSSSLVALHQACNSLQLGDCEMALAGGVNIILHSGTAVAFSQANLLSPDGRCKAFDSRADGFVRSEGAGIVLLKPLDKAIADGDPIHAVIRGTASNNDGASSPFMTPSRSGQAELLRHVYQRAGVAPGSVQYVEAHGTGTEVGDPIEIGALSDVLLNGRTSDGPIILGSSKTNLGHLEAAAGAAGLIKTVLCLQHKVIPQNLHFQTPNPNIPWADLPFVVPTETVAWPDDGNIARAGVNSFGISGTNAHVVLEAAAPTAESAVNDDTRAEVLLLSAHATELLPAVAAAYSDCIKDGTGAESRRDLCYSANVRRTQHEHRVAVVSSSREELQQKLHAFGNGEPTAGVIAGSARSEERPVFIFSGIGTQWPEMGQCLLASEPVFRASMEACDSVIREMTGRSVLEEIALPASTSRLHRIDIMQPAIFSIQVSLAALWQSWGVFPAAIAGHSLGEIAAAHVAGALSLRDAALVVCERSRLMHRTSGHGRMAAVGLSATELPFRLAPWRGKIDIAVVNSPSACAIAGDTDAVEEFVQTMDAEGIFCRLLDVNVACHSHHMEPLWLELATKLQAIAPRVATLPLYSTLLGRQITGTEVDANYWATNLRQPVQFAGAAQLMLTDGIRTFLELSPNAALLTPIRQNASARNFEVVVAGSLRAGGDERSALLESAATLHVHGATVEWKQLYPAGRFVAPPPYLWQRERFWFQESIGHKGFTSPHVAAADHGVKHGLLKLRWEPADDAATTCFEAELDVRQTPWLSEHRVEGAALLPAAAYFELALAASMELYGAGPRILRDTELRQALFLVADRPTTIQIIISTSERHARRVATAIAPEAETSLSFRIYARSETSSGEGEHARAGWALLALGHVDIPASPDMLKPPAEQRFDERELDEKFPRRQSGDEFYESITTGMEFGPHFRGVQTAWSSKNHGVTTIEVPASTAIDARAFRLHPALLDAVVHSSFACYEKRRALSLPFAMQRFELHAIPDPAQRLWCESKVVRTDSGSVAEITLFDDSGKCLIKIGGYAAKLLQPRETDEAQAARWLYETQWHEVPQAATASANSGSWVIATRHADGANVLKQQLEVRGCMCHVINLTTGEESVAAVLQSAQATGNIRGVVYLASPAPASNTTSIDPPAIAASETQALLDVLQSCAAAASATSPRIFVVTHSAKDAPGTRQLNVGQGPLAGLARVAAVELRASRVTQIDVDHRTSEMQLVNELLNADAEQEVALRGTVRYALRLERLATENRIVTRALAISDGERSSFRLESAGTGVFDDLKLHLVPREQPAAGQVEIRVAAVGLNFLDVLKGLNMAPGLPAGARFFGMECSGRIVAVGSGVDRFRVGDEVVAMDSTATGCFRAFLTTNEGAVFKKPEQLNLIDAVTIPVAYQTAYYALCELGRLRAGESILIHSCAGGVGLAALQIAQQLGATVFATAGSEAKREYLRQRGVEYVMNSRTLDFAREVMEYTNGRGVDMVLNSLAGEAITRSLETLATGGRFLEIGKRDIYADSQLGLLPFQRNLSFFAVDLLRMRMEKPQVVDELSLAVAQRMSDGTFTPLPLTRFPAAEVADAFRYMAKGVHIGKVVVTLEDPTVSVVDTPGPVQVHSDATYLITGGLGALGLAFAKRLVQQGARHLTLLGRRAPAPEATVAVNELRAQGADITVVAADVSSATELARVLDAIRQTGWPLRGVLHAAGITDDKTIQQLRWPQFESVFASKVQGAWNLHTLLRSDRLDFFVLFSSAASVMGGAGQANYAAANAFLDSLAQYRQGEGLPALAVNWGPWADVGMAALSDNRGARLADRGIDSIPVQLGTEVLDTLLQQRRAQIAVMPINWNRWAESFPEATGAPYFAGLTAERSNGKTPRLPEAGIRHEVLNATSRQEAMQKLQQHLTHDVARILRIPENRLITNVSLVRFGLDSLMAMELRNRIEADFVVTLSATRLLRGPSVTELAEWLLAEVGATVAPSTASGDGAMHQAPVTPNIDVDALSDEEVSAMLVQLLAGGQRAQ